LRGRIHFETPGEIRRDFYVYRNEDKIHFQGGPAETTEPVDLPLDIDIPLEEGVNTLTIYARLGSDLHAQRQIIVYREADAQN
jgi:hypothetical protein